MCLTLYMNEIFPSTRGVLLTAKALGVWMKLIKIDDTKKQLTLPVLEDRHFQIWNHHAIIAYLVGKFGINDDLYPQQPNKRIVIDERLRFDTEVLSFFINTILSPRLDCNKSKITNADRKSLGNVYATVENFFDGKSEWVAGDCCTVADLVLVASITSLDVVFKIDEKKFPKLTNWIQNCENLSCYGPNKEGLESLRCALCL